MLDFEKNEKTLEVKGSLIQNGIKIKVEGRDFIIGYPQKIWDKTPKEVKELMLHNLTFGDTHFLPVTLGYERIKYNTKFPVMEPFLFRNQMMDMTKSEEWDDAPSLSYLKEFYNLEFDFAPGQYEMYLPPKKQFKRKEKTAVIPFTFGKESLLSFAMCRELGIKPVLVYSQEPSMEHEEEYKKKMIKEFSKKYQVDIYFVTNGPGLFRYDAAFNKKKGTEVGWGSQTTLVAIQMLPFVYYYQADYMFFGSEYLNNYRHMREGWKVFYSYDQTSFFTKHQNAMIQIATGGDCGVRATLEPIDQINIFHLLHKRYTEIGKYQFSCTGEYPLFPNSQWCHKCYKCSRMFLYARCTGVDPYSIGFKKDLLNEPGLFDNYFGSKHTSGVPYELDFAFSILERKGDNSLYVQRFREEKLTTIRYPWKESFQYFTELKPYQNLPEEYEKKMIKIFSKDLQEFKQIIS